MNGAKRILVASGVVLAGTAAMSLASGRLDADPPTITLAGWPETAASGRLAFHVAVEDTAPGLGGWAV
ncbi:MAG: hypothetical protein VX265_07180, partial [Myxococcota bacterium]|nr:hypothetical protein [Myxococcota bacterium]